MNLVGRPTRRAARADIGTGQPRAQNATVPFLKGRDWAEGPYLDLDSVVDLTVAPENAEDPTDVAVTCAVAGLAIEHPANQLLDDDR
jgi:hypothetical protein